MSFDPNDPRLTAFVLNDPSLSESDRASVRAVLAADPAAEAFVREFGQTAKWLGETLAQEPAPPARLEATVRTAVAPKKRTHLWITYAALAACLLIGVGIIAVDQFNTREVAMHHGTDAPMPKSGMARIEGDRGKLAMKEDRGLGESVADPGDKLKTDSPRVMSLPTPGAGGAHPDLPDARKAVPGGPPMGFGGMRGGAAPAPAGPLPPGGLGGGGSGTLGGPPGVVLGGGLREPDASPPVDGRGPGAGERGRDLGGSGQAAKGAEAYGKIIENRFVPVQGEQAISTFSADVDTASYANVRRFLNQNMLPPADAVRLEELVNYFPYDYATPKTREAPFATHLEIAECPWNPKHRLARIALKGYEIDTDKRPASNLVFLIDISGSMNEPNKLPLVKAGLKLLVDKLQENDYVAIAVYASGSGLVLDSTSGMKKADILAALDNLTPGGSTNGAAGIKVAYEAAVRGFIRGGTNRVILCTDGDFNVGQTSDEELSTLITEKAKSGVFLSVLGFGMGNLKDQKMVTLANKGNGNYAYIDTLKEANKVLVEQMSGTLITIAKDVKLQLEFNPAKVAAYRLLGYEKRLLRTEDFKNDKKDAGEIGAGHTVTVLYELIPTGTPIPGAEGLVFQKPAEAADLPPALAKQSFRLKLRFKKPDGDTSTEVVFPGVDEGKKYNEATIDYRFAASVASFAMLLRDSEFKGNANFLNVLEMAQSSLGTDKSGYRKEFLDLIRKAHELKKQQAPNPE